MTSAVAIASRLPAWSTVQVATSSLPSAATARRTLILTSSAVKPTPSPAVVCTAAAAADLASSVSTPPWTLPSSLRNHGLAGSPKTARARSTLDEADAGELVHRGTVDLAAQLSAHPLESVRTRWRKRGIDLGRRPQVRIGRPELRLRDPLPANRPRGQSSP